MAKAIVAYCTKTGNTKKIADFIAEGLRFSGVTAHVRRLDEINDINVLKEYDAIIFGSPTYGGRMMEEMGEFLERVAAVDLKGKPGGSFGAFGWSGEAPDEIAEFLKNGLGIEPVGDCLRLKGAELEGGMKMAQAYGKEIGSRL